MNPRNILSVFSFIILILASQNLKTSSAQTLEMPQAKNLASSENYRLVISEVSFKNKHGGDWVKIYYNSSHQKSLNIKGLEFKDDKVFKTIEKDFWLSPGDDVTLYFKSSLPDNPIERTLYTDHKGLTATTEQLILQDGHQILDAVCWSSKNPTTTEEKELEKLFKNKGWISPDPSRCIESEKIKTSQSIIRDNRNTDSNSSQDWIIKEQNSLLKNDGINLLQKTSLQKKALLQKPKKKLRFRKSNNHPNGHLSKKIIINEIFPRTSKNDRKNEWIELYNTGEQDINLGNWRLDDEEGGSKAYIIPNITLKSHEAVMIQSSESKLSLGNKKDQVRLFDFQGKILQTVAYEEAPLGQSFSRIIVHKEDGKDREQWLWNEDSTPAQPNPDYDEFTGIIIENATFGNIYSFSFQNRKNQLKNIIFDEKLIKAPLAKITFMKNAEIKILVMKNKNSNDSYLLKNYEILSPPQEEVNEFNRIAIVFTGLAIIFIIWGYFVFIKKKL